MSAQITRDQSFPTPCKRCGGVLYQHVDFCPYCGTDRPLETAAHARADTTLRAVGPTAQGSPSPIPPDAHAARAPRDTQDSLSAGDAAATDLPPVKPDFRDDVALERRSSFRHTTHWFIAKGVLLVAFIVALGYVAYLLLGENKKPEPAPEDQFASSSGGSISPYSTQPGSADARTPAAAPKARVMPQFKDVPDSLRAARASLAQNNLSDAKAATNAALAREADNDDARDLQRDIAAREQRRDNALQGADRCASERSWGCVQRQASEALAIDSSSLHAQSLLERAILATGWTPLTPPKPPKPATAGAAATGTQAPTAAPLPRGASNVRLPSSQDWGAAASAASKDWTASAPPPPLPRMSSAPANATATATITAPASAQTGTPTSAQASAPPNASTTAPASAPSAANTNTAAAASAATPASSDNSPDAQERAIRQSGWKHAVPSDTAH